MLRFSDPPWARGQRSARAPRPRTDGARAGARAAAPPLAAVLSTDDPTRRSDRTATRADVSATGEPERQ
jgi:hypothetical protein